ncbi:MAG: hypothetical protein ACK515_02550 [bacterium]|jgi:hypothetical protein
MPQAITTRYYGPTNTKPSRIKATAEAGSVTLSWDHRYNVDKNHDRAAIELIRKMGWHGEYVRGWLPDNSGVYVASKGGAFGELIVVDR